MKSCDSESGFGSCICVVRQRLQWWFILSLLLLTMSLFCPLAAKIRQKIEQRNITEITQNEIISLNDLNAYCLIFLGDVMNST